MAVEIGSISLEKLTRVSVRERQGIVRHTVPGMEGQLAQVMGRPSVEVELAGLFFGPEAEASLRDLRALYRAGQPVDFLASAVGEGYFAQVLISGLEVWQLAGEPDQFSYTCHLTEYVEPPAPPTAGLGGLGGLDAGLLAEAAAFVDDIQNAIEQVSQLVDLVKNFPSFGDPTQALSALPNEFAGLAGGEGLDALRTLGGLL